MICGIVAGKLLEDRSLIMPSWLTGTGALGLITAWFCRKRVILWGLAFSLTIFLLGAAYFQLRDCSPNASDESPPEEIKLRLEIQRIYLGTSENPVASTRISGIGKVIATAPNGAQSDAVRTRSAQALKSLTTRAGTQGPTHHAGTDFQNQIENTDARPGDLVYFSLRKSAGVPAIRSAVILAHGVFEGIPHHPAEHSFDDYLATAGVVAKFSRGRVLNLEREATAYARLCEALRQRMDLILATGLAARAALSAENRALFLGEVGALNTGKKQLFVETGTLHFFAIDGLHIAAVAVALHLLFGLLRCPKVVAFVVTAIVLWLYADVTGRSPSAVRAVVTVLFFEGAYLLRRPINPLAGLTASAVIALLISPRELFGASFQMSYGIVAGLLLLGLPLAEEWQKGWRLFRHLPRISWGPIRRSVFNLHRHLLGSLAVGIATALVADLCGVLFFQMYAPSSLLANIILIPAASAALWACFCSVVCGLLRILWLANIFNHASAMILLGMDACIRFLVTLPAAVVPRQFISVRVGFLSIAGLLLVMIAGYATRWSWRFGGWLTPVVLCACALIFLCR